MTENLDEIKEDLLGKKTGRVIYRDNLTVFQTSGGECRFINFLGMDWHYAVSSQEGVNQYHVWFVPEVAEMLDQDTVYLAAFSLEKQAIKDHSMILHSAYMCYEDTAVLFSAPSETGKSTQAGLWEKYRGTWTVNGDRSLLIREEDDGTRMDGRSAEAQRSVTISPIRSEQSLCCHRRKKIVSAV